MAPGEKMRPLVLLGLLCCLSRSAAVRGPGAVSGHVGGSLNVTCHYGSGYEKYVKWWCRGAAWGPCRILVQTTGNEQEVRRGRVTIRDDQRQCSFTVTMGQLNLSDADTYWCGVERAGADLGDVVKVTVRPAPTTIPTTTTTTTTTAPTTLVTSDETTKPPDVGHPPLPTILGLPISLLLPIISAVLLLLLLVAALLVWRKLKQRKAASGVSPEQTPDSEVCYASLSFHGAATDPRAVSKPAPAQTPTSGRLSWTNKVQVHLDAPEEVCYAHLSLHPHDLEPTYANTDPNMDPRASRRLEEATEYSNIRKPKAGL